MNNEQWVKEFEENFIHQHGDEKFLYGSGYDAVAFISKVREEAYIQGRAEGYKEREIHNAQINQAIKKLEE